MGLAVGSGVGLVVGEGVGRGLGSGVGFVVGMGTGSGVGLGVGSGVGLGVGGGVGLTVGSGVGLGVGCAVGLEVGGGVGLGVGRVVGVGVGGSGCGGVGFGVGSVVGFRVSTGSVGAGSGAGEGSDPSFSGSDESSYDSVAMGDLVDNTVGYSVGLGIIVGGLVVPIVGVGIGTIVGEIVVRNVGVGTGAIVGDNVDPNVGVGNGAMEGAIVGRTMVGLSGCTGNLVGAIVDPTGCSVGEELGLSVCTLNTEGTALGEFSKEERMLHQNIARQFNTHDIYPFIVRTNYCKGVLRRKDVFPARSNGDPPEILSGIEVV